MIYNIRCSSTFWPEPDGKKCGYLANQNQNQISGRFLLSLRFFLSITNCYIRFTLLYFLTTSRHVIKSNTTNKDLPWHFGLYQRPSSDRDRNVKVNLCWLCSIWFS